MKDLYNVPELKLVHLDEVDGAETSTPNFETPDDPF